MISIIRLKSQEKKERICDYIMSHVNGLQESIKGKGQLLYLSKRAKHESVRRAEYINNYFPTK